MVAQCAECCTGIAEVMGANPNFSANDFLSSTMCGVQDSFSSTVIPSNRDFDTHSIVEFPMKIGRIFIGGFLLEISMASLLLGWGVNLLFRIRFYLQVLILDNNSFHLSMHFCLPFHWPRAHHVTCK